MLGRYVVRELLAPFAAWSAFLAFTFLLVAFLRGTDVLLGSSVGAGDLARILAYLTPQLLSQALPVAFLLAVLLGLGRLSEDGEVTALQALGVAPWRLMAPALALGVVLSGWQVLMAFTAQPWGMAGASAEANELIRRNLMHDVKPGVFHERVKGFSFYAEEGSPSAGWRNVLLIDGRDPQTPLLLLARRGRLRSAAGGDLVFELEDGSIHQPRPASSSYATIDFGRADLLAGLGEARLLQNRFASPYEEVTPVQLWARWRAAEGTPPAQRLEAAFHWRVGQLLMPLAFAMLAAPLALTRRAGRSRGFVFTLAGYGAYYTLARSGVQAAATGKLPALLAGQLANLCFIAVGLGLMVLVSRRGAA